MQKKYLRQIKNLWLATKMWGFSIQSMEISPYIVWRAASPAKTEVLHEKLKTVLHIIVIWKFIFSTSDFFVVPNFIFPNLCVCRYYTWIQPLLKTPTYQPTLDPWSSVHPSFLSASKMSWGRNLSTRTKYAHPNSKRGNIQYIPQLNTAWKGHTNYQNYSFLWVLDKNTDHDDLKF